MLDAMPGTLRIPLVMRDMDELSYDEIAVGGKCLMVEEVSAKFNIPPDRSALLTVACQGIALPPK